MFSHTSLFTMVTCSDGEYFGLIFTFLIFISFNAIWWLGAIFSFVCLCLRCHGWVPNVIYAV